MLSHRIINPPQYTGNKFLVKCVQGRNLGTSKPQNGFFLSWSWELGCKVMTSRHVPLERRICDLWFVISDFRFPIPDFWFLISDFWVPLSVFRFLISDFWFPFSVFRFPFSDFWFLMSVFRFLISDFWFLISVFRFPFLDLGFGIWDLGFGISVFGNQKLPAINFWVLIHEIQKTDWPQSFLIDYVIPPKKSSLLFCPTFPRKIKPRFSPPFSTCLVSETSQSHRDRSERVSISRFRLDRWIRSREAIKARRFLSSTYRYVALIFLSWAWLLAS